jgi:hypothetical protein
MIRYIIIALLGTAMLGCEKNIDIRVAEQAPIAVNSLFNPDSTWRVRIDKAWNVNEPPSYLDSAYDEATDTHYVKRIYFPMAIQDALVEITSGSGERVTLAYDTNGYYVNPAKPSAGESYTIAVNIPGQPMLSSSVVLPRSVPVDTAYISIVNEYDFLITIEFTDVPGPNTYELNAWADDDTTPPECDDPDVHVDTYWTPVNGKEDNGANFGPTFFRISDQNFQGQKKKLVLTRIGQPGMHWTIRLRTLSDEWAQYRATSVRQQDLGEDPFAEPVPVFSNIANGVGIFAGYSVIDYHFDLE